MKPLLFLIIFCISSYLSAQKVSARPTVGKATVKLATKQDTLQYDLGAYLAQWVNRNGFLITNPTLFLKGMDDMFQNKPRLVPDSSIAPFITAIQESTKKENALRQEAQLFASLKDKAGVGSLPNGIRYIILKTGKGPHPGENDTVVLNLIAKLADGTVVDDTYQSKTPVVTTVSGLFTGLSDPLQLMVAGSKWQLYIPATLAYGEKGSGTIPPNSSLIIDVELVEVRSPKK